MHPTGISTGAIGGLRTRIEPVASADRMSSSLQTPTGAEYRAAAKRRENWDGGCRIRTRGRTSVERVICVRVLNPTIAIAVVAVLAMQTCVTWGAEPLSTAEQAATTTGEQQPNEGETDLHAAALAGDTEAIRRLVAAGADVDEHSFSHYYRTPLHIAPLSGRADAVATLLALGASPDRADAYGFTPFHHAAQAGELASLEALLAAGADANAITEHGYTALHLAAAREPQRIVNFLLESGLSPDAKDVFGRTPLHYAAASGRLYAVKWLVEHNADLNCRDAAGRTPLHDAAEAGYLEIPRVLLLHKAQSCEDERKLNRPSVLAPDDTRELLLALSRMNARQLALTNYRDHDIARSRAASGEGAYFVRDTARCSESRPHGLVGAPLQTWEDAVAEYSRLRAKHPGKAACLRIEMNAKHPYGSDSACEIDGYYNSIIVVRAGDEVGKVASQIVENTLLDILGRIFIGVIRR